MELHLPYLTLRDSHNLSSPPHIGQNPSNSKPWADLTVFEQHMSGKGTVRRSIYAAHTTIVVSGWDRHKYTAYSFLDPGPDMQAAEDEQDEDSDGDSELGESDELDHEIPPEDGFATYGWQSLVDHRSRDPRVCFLRAVQIKAIVAFKENEYLIENIREITDRVQFKLFFRRPELTIPRLRAIRSRPRVHWTLMSINRTLARKNHSSVCAKLRLFS